MSNPNVPLQEIYPGLYAIAAPTAASPAADTNRLWSYFLIASSSPTTGSPGLTLSDSWTTYSGWYFFIGEEITASEAEQFVQAAYRQFPALPVSSQPSHTLLWLTGTVIPTSVPNISTQSIGRFHAIKNIVELTWSNFRLELQPSIKADLVEVNGYSALQFTTVASNLNLVNLYYYNVQQTLGYRSNGWLINLYLDGPGVGSLNFGVGLDPNQLAQNFGCNFTFVAGRTEPLALQYPLYNLGPPQPNYYAAFDIWLNPVLPQQASATRFQIDATNRIGNIGWINQAKNLISNYFFTNDGVALQLQPIDPYAEGSPSVDTIGAGFAFSTRPAQASPADSEWYLSPVGDYRVEVAASPTQTEPLRLMPGLFTREYFRVHGNDTLRCIHNQPAYAEAFHISASPTDVPSASLDMLASTYTTSWMQWQQLSAPALYFGQPSSASFFGEVHAEDFPIAIDVLLAEFDTTAAFPWVPYGGVYVYPAMNPHVSPDTFNRFEATVIGAVRHSLLTQNSSGPIFLPQNTISPAPTLLSATNPQGILIDVDSDGSWKSLTLAMEDAHPEASPPIPQTCLQFLPTGSPPRLPKDLALILTQNQLFYVVTNPGADWDFLAKTFIGGFEFDLSLGAQHSPALLERTIMVFKFNTTTTLTDLISRPALWTQAATYNENPAAVSQVLLDYIAFAQAEADAPGNPFENFNRIVTDKEWTGVLFFNAEINGNGMPTDLQMLLGGINGGLRAHHIGIQDNLFDHTASPVQLQIKKSSLFGVIFYDQAQHPPSPAVKDYPVDYEVEKLVVVFSNSAIAQFNTTVGLTLNTLFGRAVAKRNGSPGSPDIAPNTLSIKGQYQSSSDGVGRVTFLSSQAFVYDLVPAGDNASLVVDYVQFDQATLVPISSSVDSRSGDTVVQAQFALAGALWFNADPFPHSDQLDLFSYGNGAANGLPIANVAVNIQFLLGADGTTVPGSKSVQLDISGLTAAPANAGIRPNSLLFSIPLKFSRFLSASAGHPLNANTLGATTVNILQLEGPTTKTQASPSVSGLPSSYATSSAMFGLEYDMLLGSLGALGANAKLNAKVILAWGPSATVPDNDAAALFVQLPQLSAGAGGFELEGILKTTFGDANLLKVDLADGQQTVYAFLFNNIQLSVFGYRFPPGVLIDFMVFAGATTPGTIQPTYANNLAWFLSAQPQKTSP